MKRDEGCKGCMWNFGADIPCWVCEDYDLYFSWKTGDKKTNAEVQEEDNVIDGL